MIYGSEEFIDKIRREYNIEAVMRQKRETEEREKRRKNRTVSFYSFCKFFD